MAGIAAPRQRAPLNDHFGVSVCVSPGRHRPGGHTPRSMNNPLRYSARPVKPNSVTASLQLRAAQERIGKPLRQLGKGTSPRSTRRP